MVKIQTTKIAPYKVGYGASWVEPFLGKLSALVKSPAQAQEKVLGGRRKVNIVSLAPGIDIAVKKYARGGLIGHIVKETYIKYGKTRCLEEFEWLQKVRRLGIRAPEPVAFLSQGRWFYRCWLITGAVKDHQTLADLNFSTDAQAKAIFTDLAEQVGILIRNQILHVDLHPGNVLIDNSDLPYIIDFDKAFIFSGDRSKLKARYISRWCRAIEKHRLNPLLADTFQEHLVSNGMG